MRPNTTIAALFVVTTLLLSGCITGSEGTFDDADVRIGATLSGPHDDRLCVPSPREDGDSVTIKLFMDLEGEGEIVITDWDGPKKVEEIAGKTDVLNGQWHRGWNTGEICIDVAFYAKGVYAIGAYLD
ncbi:MAG: hypothetical protein KY455_08275 [Euryarchaeota archaeon]|nr:hypothetical protein [Euryarchaeota archaeon]